MKQLTQILKSGKMEIQEVSIPSLQKGMVLVQNYYSLISAGTEGSTVKTARKSLIGKAKERPQQVKQVIDTFQKLGPAQTYRAVMKKLDAYSPLGYSSSGLVIGVGEGVTEFKIGDKVACAGVGYANHAEINSVPVNLCIKLDEKADLLKASYNTLGAIAMQGVRQADLRVGESCVIIGLGLLGQLTAQIFNASGVKTFGIDVSQSAVDISNQHSTFKSWLRKTDGLSNQIYELTNGQGVDAVIITAGTSSLDPINFAGEITRKKGKVVVVGAVPTGFDRDPYYYKKELDLRMSCSYGPGRYDLNYEEKGIDYPYPYVRWTERRNMQAFQELISMNKIDLDYLTTHQFDLDEAPKAYDMIMNGSESYLGIVIKYDTEKEIKFEPIKITNPKVGKINIGFIGAGSYAQSHLLPNIPKSNDISLKGIITNTGTTSKRVAEKYGFEFCASQKEDILHNYDINTIFIATRHDSHAAYVIEALQNNKNVFVEKPLALTELELDTIVTVYNSQISNLKSHVSLMVGFNRRFAPLALEVKKKLSELPMSIIYRINSGEIPIDSWIQDSEIGGGRVIGEVCHFIDFLTWINGSLPTSIFASAMKTESNKNDTVVINISFKNGSVGTINYFSNGSKSLPKEYIEVYQSNTSYIIKDFKELEIWGSSKSNKKLLNQDKGQTLMVQKFIESLNRGESLIPIEEIFKVTLATFKVLESIRTSQSIRI